MITDPKRINPANKYIAVTRVAVTDQMTRHLLPATSFSQLGGDPFGRRMCGDAGAQNPKRDCRHHKQVHCRDPIRMIAKECLPTLGWRPPPPRHVFGDAGPPNI